MVFLCLYERRKNEIWFKVLMNQKLIEGYSIIDWINDKTENRVLIQGRAEFITNIDVILYTMK